MSASHGAAHCAVTSELLHSHPAPADAARAAGPWRCACTRTRRRWAGRARARPARCSSARSRARTPACPTPTSGACARPCQHRMHGHHVLCQAQVERSSSRPAARLDCQRATRRTNAGNASVRVILQKSLACAVAVRLHIAVKDAAQANTCTQSQFLAFCQNYLIAEPCSSLMQACLC